MSQCLRDSLKKIDRFGAIFKPTFLDLHQQYRSTIGGIATLIIYGLCLSYFCYKIAQWQSNQLLPKITITQTSYDYKEYLAQENIFSFYMRKGNITTHLDPFDPQNLILQPIIYVFKNSMLISSMSFSFSQKSQRFNNTQIYIGNLSFIHNVQNTFQNPQLEYFVTFGTCQEKYLQSDQKCANQTMVDTFMGQRTNLIIVNKYVQEYNTKQSQLVTVPRESFTFFSNSSTFYSQNHIQLGETYVDNGFLFESYKRYEYISDVEVITQQLKLEQFQSSLGRLTYLVYHFRIGQIMQTQYIEYPKISEVLAEIGSITSLILLMSFIFTFLNECELEKKSMAKVIEMYYPEMANIRIEKNWLGQLVKVYLNDSQIEKDQFLQYYNRLKAIAKKKMSISNILFTLSKLQFLIQSNYNVNEIKLAHNIGIKLKSFKKINQENDNDLSQTNLRVIEMEDSKIHCQSVDLINNENKNVSPNVSQEKKLFIQPCKTQCHQLSDEDFSLFTIQKTYDFDQEQLKFHQYYQQNYIGI